MSKCPFHFLSRRSFLKSAGLIAAGANLGMAATAAGVPSPEAGALSPEARTGHGVPFWGKHQAGITTPQQTHSYFVVFDLMTKKREDVVQLLKDWTEASAQLTEGKILKVAGKKSTPPPKDQPHEEDSYSGGTSTTDSGEVLGLNPARLTLTFGFGPSLFKTKDGLDRFGLAKRQPEALVDLPKFHGDELAPEKTGGDISIQACSDDQQVTFHAIRQLARFADGIAQIRWAQTGFLPGGFGRETPRNLMGFKDGTVQPKPNDLAGHVWASNHQPEWLHGGTYMVARRIRMALEHWDKTEVEFQEQVIGRSKTTGAPLGQRHERETLNLKATDKDGNFVIPENAHVRLATAATNDGALMLRRGYSYNDGVNMTAERWPPWRQGMEYDAGLFFVSYQSDPRIGFIKIFQNMAKIDALNQFVTHVGGGLFACPPGAQRGEYIGQKLFEA